MTYKEALEIVITMAERYYGRPDNPEGFVPEESEALDKVTELKDNIDMILQ